MKKLLFVLGTRPEAIKLAPLICLAKLHPQVQVRVCSTGQHKQMLAPILSFFDIAIDIDLDIMTPNQSLNSIASRTIEGVDHVLKKEPFDWIIVQGDTTTCLSAALAGFYQRVPVAHVEAGLRSNDLSSPYPEELNRICVSKMASLHLAPTSSAVNNLIKEGVQKSHIVQTGNTGIDALLLTSSMIKKEPAKYSFLNEQFSFLNFHQHKLIIATIHRRESFGAPMRQIFLALKEVAKKNPLVQILIPLHMNPMVRAIASEVFDESFWLDQNNIPSSQNTSNLFICNPLDYISFVFLMEKSYLLVTDSGGIQEEAPSLRKPILVARQKTERPEGVAAGCAKLLPQDQEGMVKAINSLLEQPDAYEKMQKASATNPYGDGKASKKILDAILAHHSKLHPVLK